MKRTLDSKHRDVMTTMALQRSNDDSIPFVVSFFHIALDGFIHRAKAN